MLAQIQETKKISYTINKKDSHKPKKGNIPTDKNTTTSNTEGLKLLILQSLAAEAIKTKTVYSEIKPDIESFL